MAKSLLRSGSLADFFALGENGQPVYASALQLRETLRLRRQQAIADCLAIPQPNETGDRIDWYAPVEGKITSWMAASEAERETALDQLEASLATVAHLSQQALASEKPAQQRFGALLAKAFQFPAANYVYLVQGRPVITFWGFINVDQKPRSDALACLREAQPAMTAPPLIDTPIPPVTVPSPAPASAAAVYAENATLPLEPENDDQPAPQVVIPAKPKATPSVQASPLRRWWWVIPGIALVAALVWQFRGGVSKTPVKPAPAVVVSTPEKRVLPATEKNPEPSPVTPIAPPPLAAVPQPDATATSAEQLALAANEKKAQESTENKTAEEAKPVENKPIPKNALVMPPLSIKLGKTDFLNGTWRVTVEGKTPNAGKPSALRYQLRNGQGTVRTTQSNGVTCRADVNTGLMQSGNLIINTRGSARCTDGSRYLMPEIVCTQGATGAAECSARYDADTVLPLTIKRESE